MSCNPPYDDPLIHNLQKTYVFHPYLGLYHDDLCCCLPPCTFLPSEYECFFGFINMYSLDFCLISPKVCALSFESVLYVASIIINSSLLTPSMNFEAMLKFLLFADFSGSLFLLKL